MTRPTTPSTKPRRHRLARILAVSTVAVALPVAYAGAASADVPEGWRDSTAPHVSLLHALLLLGGVPLTVIVLLALATYLPSIVRGESVAPAGARADDEWFGGRRDATKALESGKASEDTGGASGSW